MNASTPFYADKSFWLVVIGMLAPVIAKRIGLQLDVDALAAQAASIVAFVVMSKWKQATLMKAEAAGTQAASGVATTADALKAMDATK